MTSLTKVITCDVRALVTGYGDTAKTLSPDGVEGEGVGHVVAKGRVDCRRIVDIREKKEVKFVRKSNKSGLSWRRGLSRDVLCLYRGEK